LRQLTEDKQRLENREIIFQAIKKHMPRLAAMFVGDSENPTWDGRFTSIEQSWNWARANAWLHEFHRDQDAEKLEAELTALQRNLQRAMAELSAEKAWRHCFSPERFTENRRRHLMAWKKAIQRIGKGTGPRAELHRANAKEHLKECRDASQRQAHVRRYLTSR
jgi:hypothetical protein